MLDPSSNNIQVTIEEIRITIKVTERSCKTGQDQVQPKRIVLSGKPPGNIEICGTQVP
jgi:hypothetical protein